MPVHLHAAHSVDTFFFLLDAFSFPFCFFSSLNCGRPADHANCGSITSGHVIVSFGSTWLPSNCPGLSYQAILTPRSRIPCFMFLFFLWYELSFLPTCLLWYTWVNQLLRLEFWSQTAEIWWVCVFFFYPLINHWASLQDVLGLTHLYFWWICKWLLSFHVTDGICAKHVIDQIAPIGKDQILHVVKGIIFHSGFTVERKKRRRNSHTCRSVAV